jgi:CheY-like chemotaxis protein
MADPFRLMQVMANLLSNAAKFSPKGSTVVVRASKRGSLARVEVQDSGIGIPEEFHRHIFEKFAQADASVARRFEGTGLGLSITRQLLKAMDGTIGFTTEMGRGTIFHFELPLADPLAGAPGEFSDSQQQEPALTSDSTSNEDSDRVKVLPRILHVEDDPDLSNVLRAALAGKIHVINAPTLAAAQVMLRDESFVAIVLDPKLPDGNGLTLLDEFPVLALQQIPIVVFSASEVSPEIRSRVRAVLIKSRVSEAFMLQTLLSLAAREN